MVGPSLTEFADRMNEIMPILAKEFVRRHVSQLYKGKITLPQCLILEFLQREGETKMTTLAKFMNVSTAAMTGIVDRLVRSGYSLRAHQSEDRRIVKIKLTASGQELVRKFHAHKRAMLIHIFSRVSERDRRDYLRVLTRIRDILTKEEET
ncbi:MAG: MarR family transcriptional regulator [Candidatus Omnitrophica bacterium]|nr:MarR family transcriptional regulator [Candidatus Omnitrophota bacterium]